MQENALSGCVTRQRRHRIAGQIAGLIAVQFASGHDLLSGLFSRMHLKGSED
jgi:hypothetical protein